MTGDGRALGECLRVNDRFEIATEKRHLTHQMPAEGEWCDRR
jgi:hypothetical protein